MSKKQRKAEQAAERETDALIVARQALRLARGMVGSVERKVYQQTTTTNNYLAGNVTNIFAPAQGDGVGQRTGDAVRLKKVTIRMSYATFTDSTVTWRFILFHDKRQVSGVTPTVTTVLATDTATSQVSVDTRGRFAIHRDITVTQIARFLNGDMSDVFVWDVPLNLETRWAGGIGNLNQNGLYVLITCDVQSAASMVAKPAAGDCATRYTVDAEFTDD